MAYARNEMREYMRDRRAKQSSQKQREERRREFEAQAVSLAALRAQVDHWPLRQGYNAAERGQPYDEQQPFDWRVGWRLWQRRHGKAA